MRPWNTARKGMRNRTSNLFHIRSARFCEPQRLSRPRSQSQSRKLSVVRHGLTARSTSVKIESTKLTYIAAASGLALALVSFTPMVYGQAAGGGAGGAPGTGMTGSSGAGSATRGSAPGSSGSTATSPSTMGGSVSGSSSAPAQPGTTAGDTAIHPPNSAMNPRTGTSSSMGQGTSSSNPANPGPSNDNGD